MPAELLRQQLARALADLGAPEAPIQLERPRNPEHGDLATNAALILARRLGKPPRQTARLILEKLDLPAAGVSSAEIAGPGFINFRFGQALLAEKLRAILEADRAYGRSSLGAGRRIQVEFVSANPTGPLHVAHGRGAALGDAVAQLLDWTGYEVAREFYVNDAGAQVDKLIESLGVRWRQLRGEPADLPEEGYHGEYVIELARALEREQGEELRRLAAAERRQLLREWALERLRAEQDRDLRQFRVFFDSYYFESQLYREGKIEETLNELVAHGLTCEAEGAVWLRTTAFGDDKDRVLVKSDGSYTYFLPDLAYHRDKARRGFQHVIDVWGADHHGYVPRMRAGLLALGLRDFLDVEIVQMVRIMSGGREVKLSKRLGELVTLRELFEQTGVDVARYFFLMRRGDAQMLFDLDLALDHSEKNPVYKIQYAHARMMSIFRKGGVAPADITADAADLARLATAAEQDLIKQLGEFPALVERAAEARAPHLVCDYLEETAGSVNSWYHAGNPSRNPALAVLVPDPELRQARLALARGVQIVLRNGLELLGLTAPERMEREEAE
ncbi:MAG: arginine--tRNA ligase [Gemmatimonadetes bacterium]|nr:arginine--tRNA ligase [Gemmatimonadota bacterium]